VELKLEIPVVFRVNFDAIFGRLRVVGVLLQIKLLVNAGNVP
jgi:hypothetical protein